jgi:hypothetical protein
MQPIKPEEVERILNQRPQVTREHIHEYQKLVAHHFDTNPRLPKSEAQQAAHEERERRRKELHDLIYG